MHDLRDLIDSFDRVVASAEGLVDEDLVAAAALVGRAARARRGYLGETVVAALAGGTGSGKSSIINALAGEEVTETGPLRPTTSDPLAWIPVEPEPGVIRLLEDLGVERRVGQDRVPWLVVIDLPDTDSVVVEHHATVDQLIPRVDAIVWVADPEKYQDRVLHAGYVARRAGYRDQFVFVLNQVDRLTDEETQTIVEDFTASLAAEGIEAPRIVTLAAAPDAGPPQGVDELVEAMRSLGVAKDVVTRKLVVDLDESVGRLAEAAGVSGAGSTGFDGRWQSALNEAAEVVGARFVRPSLEARAVAAGSAAGRSAVGLLPGRTAPADWSADDMIRPIGETAGVLASVVAETADLLAAGPAAALRSISDRIDDEVDAALSGMVLSTREVRAPGWLGLVAWLRRLAVLAAVVAPVWVYDAWRRNEDLLLPVIALVSALFILAAGRGLGSAAGSRRARRSVDEEVRALTTAFSGEVDRRIGLPVRMELRRRAGLVGALTEYTIAREKRRVSA